MIQNSDNSIEVTNAAIQTAEDHQEERCPGWKDEAYRFLKNYAEWHPEFTAEDVREAAEGIVPFTIEPRAWGGVFAKARNEGIIAGKGYVPMKALHSHRKPTTLWGSQVFTTAH